MSPRSQEGLPPPPSQEVIANADVLREIAITEQVGKLALVDVNVEAMQSAEIVQHQERLVTDAPAIGATAVDSSFGKVKSFFKNKFSGDAGGNFTIGQETDETHDYTYDIVYHPLVKQMPTKNPYKTAIYSAQSPDDEVHVLYTAPEVVTSSQESNQEQSEYEEWWKEVPLNPGRVEFTGFVEIDSSQVVDSKVEVSPAIAAELLETQRVVKAAPNFRDVPNDMSRENTVTHIDAEHATGGRSAYESDTTRQETEQQAAKNLVGFFEDYIVSVEQSDQPSDYAIELADRANDMLDSLTFIGEKERSEAVRGIAEYWKSFLSDNPDRQICALAQISGSGEVKSDKFLLDSILGEFSDEDIEELGDRLVLDLESVTAAPEDTKIILLDDWIISGSQMTSAYRQIRSSEQFAEYSDSVEIQLVTSPKHRIENGLSVTAYGKPNDNVPIRAYFLSHDSLITTAYEQHNAYETGTHSSVDYDFEQSYIQPMLQELKKQVESVPGAEEKPLLMPSLTTIDRPYRRSSLDNINRLSRRRKPEAVSVGSETNYQDNLKGDWI